MELFAHSEDQTRLEFKDHNLPFSIPGTPRCYLLSFIYLIIYWNNHHHFLRTLEIPNAWTMWANAHLLFWLSLIPFSTAWLGANEGASASTELYDFTLLMPAIAYTLLELAIIKTRGDYSPLEKALGRDVKGKLSVLFYVAA